MALALSSRNLADVLCGGVCMSLKIFVPIVSPVVRDCGDILSFECAKCHDSLLFRLSYDQYLINVAHGP